MPKKYNRQVYIQYSGQFHSEILHVLVLLLLIVPNGSNSTNQYCTRLDTDLDLTWLIALHKKKQQAGTECGLVPSIMYGALR